MPTGLPTISALASQVTETLTSAATYLQIPEYATYKSACQVAANDVVVSTKSTWHLLVLTLTPLCIILKLLTHLFLIGLGIIAEHTIKHGIVAIKEAASQVRTGVTWFCAWQRTLSPAAVAIELTILASCVGLYILRQYIQKHRYVERTQRWFRRKHNAFIKQYNEVVRSVSETSILLALLLPHLLYVVGVVALHYVAPWLLRYFALHTPTTTIISLWIPIVRTVMFLHRWNQYGSIDYVEDDKAVDGAASPNGSATTTRKRTTGSATSRAAERYLDATMKSSDSTAATRGKKRMDRISTDQALLRAEGMDLLRYWVVYALLYALLRALSMLPVVGNLVTATAAKTAQKTSRWAAAPAKPGRIGTMISSLRPSEQLLKETKMVFFIWLLYLPTSLTGAAVENTSKASQSVKDKVSAWETKIGSGDLNRPINIVYNRLAPIAVSVADFSLQLTREGRNQNGKSTATASSSVQTSTASSMLASLLTKCIGFIRSVLEVTVFTRMISPSTRDWILTAIADGAALLPAAITLVMPGYFTEFGVLYVANVVPAANSTVARDAEAGTPMARYLRYWVIHTLLSGLLASFRPVLVWIPLSTHATLILWAYIQLEPVVSKLYALVEWELTAFGLFRAQKDMKDGDGKPAHDIDKTVTLQLLRKASSMLPKAGASQQEESGTNNTTSSAGEKKEGEVREEATTAHQKVD